MIFANREKLLKIYFLYYQNVNTQFIELTYDIGLKNIAKKLNVAYQCVAYKPDQKDFIDVDTTNDKIAVFFFCDIYRTREISDLKNRCPNSVLFQLGGDVIYDKSDTMYYTDVHIDTMEDSNELFKNKGVKTHLIHWTISSGLDIPNTKCDKNNDVICLCRNGTSYRKHMVDSIRNKYSIVCGINNFNINEVIQLYKTSYITLGTTSPVFENASQKSLKGFRDWLGPICDSILIYDDHPQLMKYFDGIIPFYKYGDMDSLMSLIDKLKTDRRMYRKYLDLQKNWIKNNYMENQLEKIIGKYYEV